MWQFLKDLEIEIPFDPAIPIYICWVYTQRIINHSIIKTNAYIRSWLHCKIVKTWTQPKCPSAIDWIRKMWNIYTIEYYATIKNDEFVTFVGIWMNLETIIFSKVTQEQKIKHHMFLVIGGCWTWEHMDTVRGASHTGTVGGAQGRDSGG